GLAGARDVVAQTAARGRLDEDTATTIAASLSATTDLAELAGCDLVIEAVPEVLEIKRSVFAELESVLDADALLVTKTCRRAVTDLARDTDDAQRVAGLCCV